MEPGKPDSKGKRSVLPVPGTEFIIPVDMVIKAIGQEAQNDLSQQFRMLNLSMEKFK